MKAKQLSLSTVLLINMVKNLSRMLQKVPFRLLSVMNGIQLFHGTVSQINDK